MIAVRARQATGSPDESGSTRREQGLAKAGAHGGHGGSKPQSNRNAGAAFAPPYKVET